jgi:quinolinate synthase
MSDVICTSSNALKIVEKAPQDRPILFAPDRNLGRWVMEKTGREMTLWQGSCIVHETFSEKKIIDLRTANPGAQLISHPECEDNILQLSDYIGSTSQLLKYVIESKEQTFIVATEAGILHQMQKKAPNKKLIAAPPNQNCACNECPFMKLNTLEKLAKALEDEGPGIEVPEAIMEQARASLTRMLEWSN